MDRGEFCALVLLDLSAAFDTIDHGLLFDVLEKRFGMSHDALKWMTSYFEGGTQTFRVGNEDSDPRTLMFGVPQGSFAGPQTFVCYTEDLH